MSETASGTSNAPSSSAKSAETVRVLALRVGSSYVVVPIASVVETMRPLAVEPVANVPSYVLGLAVVRGVAAPVIDAARLLGSSSEERPTRFVTLRSDPRILVLAVHSVAGIRDVRSAKLGAAGVVTDVAHDPVERVGVLDDRITTLLRVAKVLDAATWATLDAREAASAPADVGASETSEREEDA